MDTKTLVGFATALMLLTVILPLNISLAQTSKDLGIVPLFQHKDTRMLCLSSRESINCSLTGKHAWDIVHEVKNAIDVLSCTHCEQYCGFASIAMIVSFFGGNLSQDRIAYFRNTSPEMGGPWLKHPDEDLFHAGLEVTWPATKTLSWVLNGATILYYDGKPSLDEIKGWIDENRPILTLVPMHFMVTKGYDGSYIHWIDPTSATELRVPYADVEIISVWIPPADATARSDEPELWLDTDSDGVVDFDEKNRFFTNPYGNDTDNDGITDKIEIQSYTFIGDVHDDADVRKPDTDGDGLRAELDIDSDNGGIPDGLEDLNHNGRLDPGETDPFNKSDDPYIPPPIANFTHAPEKPAANETITFDASTSYSPKGNITSYEWNFNDGNTTTVTTPIISHNYTQPAKYNVTLTVRDNNTLTNTTSKIVSVFYVTDLNKNGSVNIVDITIVATAYNSRPGDPKWNELADLDKNNLVNIIDITMVAKDFNKSI